MKQSITVADVVVDLHGYILFPSWTQELSALLTRFADVAIHKNGMPDADPGMCSLGPFLASVRHAVPPLESVAPARSFTGAAVVSFANKLRKTVITY